MSIITYIITKSIGNLVLNALWNSAWHLVDKLLSNSYRKLVDDSLTKLVNDISRSIINPICDSTLDSKATKNQKKLIIKELSK